MWNRFLVAGLATSVLMLSAVGSTSAEAVDFDAWTAFAQQQPMLSHVFVTHQTAAVANFFDMSPDQLRSELAERSLAEMAAARNRTASDVAAVMLDSANRDLQLATSFGLISHESRADLKAQFEEVLPGLIAVPAPPVIAIG